MTSLWNARFSKDINENVKVFNDSIGFDKRMYKQDIHGSIAHTLMLQKQKIIPEQDAKAIIEGLKEIEHEIKNGQIDLDGYEDIHMAIEEILTSKIGDAGKKLHTGRSRNDQTALDLRMYTRDEIREIVEQLKELEKTICSIAAEHLNTIMPGYTHMQRAQPITFAHELMAYANMFKRDIKRLKNTLEVMDESPLGSGALAGTTYPLDREYTAKLLGFSKACDNSIDGVSDRDYCLETLSDLSILMMHLSRLCEEIILWCSWEFKFVELDDAFATGSSIMPQKKNPDICELVRGKTGRVYGDLFQLFTVMKALPLAYNKDMQEDKESLFDALDTVKSCLGVLNPMLSSMEVLTENMEAAASRGFINATDMADYLTKKGMPFRDAYKVSGEMVSYAIKKNMGLSDLSLEEMLKFSTLFDEDIFNAIDLHTCASKRATKGGPAPAEVSRQIQEIRKIL